MFTEVTALSLPSKRMEENAARGIEISPLDREGQAGFAPARSCERLSHDKCVYEVSACSLPPKRFWEKNRQSSPRALPDLAARCQALVFAALLAAERGDTDVGAFERSSFTFTTQK